MDVSARRLHEGECTTATFPFCQWDTFFNVSFDPPPSPREREGLRGVGPEILLLSEGTGKSTSARFDARRSSLRPGDQLFDPGGVIPGEVRSHVSDQ